MIGLIGKKIKMTQMFIDGSKNVPVTAIKAGPCMVVQRKTAQRDGYDSVQLGFDKEVKNCSKPKQGHFKSKNIEPHKYLREFKLHKYKDIQQGEVLDCSMFVENELIDVVGRSKGKGFAGVMKRHGFKGFTATHGVHESFRGGGSIGQCATPSRVMKGKKMAGHLGDARITIKNVQIMSIDTGKNIIMVKGSIPGHRNSIVLLKKEQ